MTLSPSSSLAGERHAVDEEREAGPGEGAAQERARVGGLHGRGGANPVVVRVVDRGV